MKVGIPAEISPNELRVAATPKTVKRLQKQGFDVYIQHNAGLKANFSDKDFEEAGAKIVNTATDIYSQSDIVLKVKEPSMEEVDLMHEGLVLLSYLWPAQNQPLLQKLADKKVNAVAMDAIPRISRAQKMDVLSSMANIAGYRAVIEGSYHFGRFLNGQITAAGKVEPAKVLVIGAGVAGLAAIGAANSLGAIVRAFDTRKEVAEQIESMGAQFLTVEIEEDGATASGYSKEMSKEFIEAEMKLFLEQAKEVDIVITTAQIPGRKAPILITEEMLNSMKNGSVIIDLAASTGGNTPFTKNNETVNHNGISIIGNSSLQSTMSSDASKLYGKNITNFLQLIIDKDANLNLNWEDDLVKGACITHNGEITNDRVKSILSPSMNN